MSIKVIFFDLDETLLASHNAEKMVLNQVASVAQEKHGVDPAVLADQVWDSSKALWQQLSYIDDFKKVGIAYHEGLWGSPGEAFVLDEFRLESWNQALKYLGVEDRKLAAEMAEKYLQIKPAQHLLFEDSLPCLQDLKDFRLGLLTNGAVPIQSAKIEFSGVKPYFEKIYISGQFGIGKPAPDIFLKAMADFGVSAAEAVMVGDSLNNDVQGANNLGIKSIWLNRFGEKRLADSPKPDVEIADLTGLRGVI